VIASEQAKAKVDARDRIDRNADGSPDDIVIMLEPDLMLRAEEMDDGLWWVAIHDMNGKQRSIAIDVRRHGKKRFRWHAVISDDSLLPEDWR
jgi:hypothetical protein